MSDLYPMAPGAKVDGTSLEAAEEMVQSAEIIRERIMDLLKSRPHILHGLTPDQAAAHLQISILSVRPRFSELVGRGMIRATGERRQNKSRKMANVYVAVLPRDQLTLNY